MLGNAVEGRAMTTTMSAPRTRWVLPASAATGILFMLVAQLLVMPANDAVVKYLVASLPIAQLAWARFFFNFLLLAPVTLWHHRRHALAPVVLGQRLQVAVDLLAQVVVQPASLDPESRTRDEGAEPCPHAQPCSAPRSLATRPAS